MDSPFNSVKNIEKYVREQTGKKLHVTRTERQLTLFYVKDGEIETVKVEIPAGVLYCLKYENFNSAIEQIKERN